MAERKHILAGSNQCKIYPFQSGGIQLKGICEKISEPDWTGGVYDQSESG